MFTYASAVVNYSFGFFGLAIQTSRSIVSDAEALQKSCIFFQSIFKALDLMQRQQRFNRLIEILEVAQSFDFYGFSRLPKRYFHPYSIETIDRQVIESQVSLAKHQLLTNFFLEIEKEEQVFTAEEFRNALSGKVGAVLPSNINLLKKESWLAYLIDWTFIFVDIACIPVFLQDWSLLNLSRLASVTGINRMIDWSTKISLDEIVRWAMCLGFSLQFIQAVNQLSDGKEESKKEAWRSLATSTAEFFYNYAILKHQSIAQITALAFFAKLFGLYQILSSSRPRAS
jgi:hypothetical protein